MRTGNQPRRSKRLSANNGVEASQVSADANGTVVHLSQDGLENQPKRAKKSDNGLKRNEKQGAGVSKQGVKLNSEISAKDAIESATLDNEAARKNSWQSCAEENKDIDECDWEEGLIQVSNSATNNQNGQVNAVTVEFFATPNSSSQKYVHRFTVEEKEIAELVHKVHLLCLIARGRLIDSACNDPLIQAALLSQLPPDLLKISEVTKLTVNALSPLVTWFHKNFRIRSTTIARKPFPSGLSLALGTQEGSPEEVVALSVALFRALNLSARFVSILDVATFKPERDKPRDSCSNANDGVKDIFNSSTLMVTGPDQEVKRCSKSPLSRGKNRCGTSLVDLSNKMKAKNLSRETEANKFNVVDDTRMKDPSVGETSNHADHAQCSGRKGDLEFERQMEMALSATAAAMPRMSSDSDVNASQSGSSSVSSPFRKVRTEEPSSSSQNISMAIGSEKVGAPLCWAEVYCNGENMTGKWVHIDVVHALIDAELRVEAAASACKKSLRYVVAFARNGAKDVTRRMF